MAKRPRTANKTAALMAGLAGLLMIASGVTGASQWQRSFALLEGILGARPLLNLVAFVFVALGSVGGAAVLVGAYAFLRNRVRSGKLLILFGTGFSIVSLTIFLVLTVRSGDWPYAGASTLGFVGVVLSVAARMKTRRRPQRG